MRAYIAQVNRAVGGAASEDEARGVLAFMYDQHGTLDGLSLHAFEQSARESLPIVRANPDMADRLAASYGV